MDTATFTIPRGSTVKDNITGFAGVVTGRCDYITGCNQYAVQPAKKDDGTFIEARWFDEHRLAVMPGAPMVLQAPVDDRGGACDLAPLK